MKFNIKKFFVCLIVFSCAMFLGHSNGLANTSCYYESIDIDVESTEGNNFLKEFMGNLMGFGSNDVISRASAELLSLSKLDLYYNIDSNNIATGSAKFTLKTPNDMQERFFDVNQFPTDGNCKSYLSISLSRTWDGKYSVSATPLDYVSSPKSVYSTWYVEAGFLVGGNEHRLTFYLKRNDDDNNTENFCKETYSSSINEITQIFNNFPSEIIKQISELKDGQNIDEIDQNVLDKYLPKTAYFDNCTNINTIATTISGDASFLEDFQNGMFDSCILEHNKTNDTNVNVKDVKFDGYTYGDIQKLEYLLKSISNTESIKSICNLESAESYENVMFDECAGFIDLAGTIPKYINEGYANAFECQFDKEKKLISSFNCASVADYAETGILPEDIDGKYQKFLDIFITQYDKCTDKTGVLKYNCIKQECEKTQKSDKNISNVLSNMHDKAQDIRKEYSNLIVNSYTNLVNITNIKTDTEICDFLYGKTGIGNYIVGALNLIQIGGIIITIILSIMDGIKSFASFKDDESKKFFNNLKIRLICIALLIIIPTIIKFLVNIVGNSCPNSKI